MLHFIPLPPNADNAALCAVGNSASGCDRPYNSDDQDVAVLGSSHASGISWSHRFNTGMKSYSFSSRNSEWLNPPCKNCANRILCNVNELGGGFQISGVLLHAYRRAAEEWKPYRMYLLQSSVRAEGLSPGAESVAVRGPPAGGWRARAHFSQTLVVSCPHYPQPVFLKPCSFIHSLTHSCTKCLLILITTLSCEGRTKMSKAYSGPSDQIR